MESKDKIKIHFLSQYGVQVISPINKFNINYIHCEYSEPTEEQKLEWKLQERNLKIKNIWKILINIGLTLCVILLGALLVFGAVIFQIKFGIRLHGVEIPIGLVLSILLFIIWTR